MKVFGPVPSRRLGQSLGVNNIPPKRCSYSCVYCQLGRTDKMQIERQAFYSPEELEKELETKLGQLKNSGDKVDYITFVTDGEPELDINLGKEIELFKRFGIKIAVICNSSLVWDGRVRKELCSADWVSLKVDTVDEDIWRKIDRPHGKLSLERILEGIMEFSEEFGGQLVTETMLVQGINDSVKSLADTAKFIKKAGPSYACLLVPTRPPAESGVKRLVNESIRKAYEIYTKEGLSVNLITGDEGESFVMGNDIKNDILDIVSVHPIKKQVLERLISQKGGMQDIIEEMIESSDIESFEHEGNTFYIRKTVKKRD